MNMTTETIQALRDAKMAYQLSQARNGGQQTARTRYLNLMSHHADELVDLISELEAAEKKIADLTEENEMLNDALEKQDKELDELKTAAAPKTTARKK